MGIVPFNLEHASPSRSPTVDVDRMHHAPTAVGGTLAQRQLGIAIPIGFISIGVPVGAP